MKNFKRLISISLITLMFTAPAYAGSKGQIDFADLSSYYGEPKVEINLSSGLMKMVGSFAKSEDPEVAEIFI